MEHSAILRDLVIVYGIGALVIYVFQKVRQPNIVGFLVTGILVGPYGMSLVGSPESVRLLAHVCGSRGSLRLEPL